MIDAQRALSLVGSGMAEPGWQVLPMRTGGLVGRLIGGLFVALIGAFGAGGGFFFFAGAFGDISPMGAFALLPLVVGVIFAAVGVIGLLWAFSGVRLMFTPKAQRPVLILAPDGVVERGGFWGNRVRAVAYADIAHAQMLITTNTTVNAQTGARSSTVSHSVIFPHRNGKKERWNMDGSFGRPDHVASQIITAQIQYEALRGMAPGQAPQQSSQQAWRQPPGQAPWPQRP